MSAWNVLYALILVDRVETAAEYQIQKYLANQISWNAWIKKNFAVRYNGTETLEMMLTEYE